MIAIMIMNNYILPSLDTELYDYYHLYRDKEWDLGKYQILETRNTDKIRSLQDYRHN